MSTSEEQDYIGLSEPPQPKLKTDLSLGLPGSHSPERERERIPAGAKRGFRDALNAGSEKWGLSINAGSHLSPTPNSTSAPAPKAQVVGWPPVRSSRKNTNLAPPKNKDSGSGSNCLYVKVSMDGAPYLRKIDLKTYPTYAHLSSALENMFTCFTIEGQYGQEQLSESHLKDLLHGSEYVLTYEDKDGDWMLVGDVPWEMFTDSCKRLRIMKGSDAIGLAPRTMQKCKSQN